MRQSLHISPEDLVATPGRTIDLKKCDAYLLDIVADEVVELSDFGGTDADFVAQFISEDYPALAQRYGRRYIKAVAESMLGADIVSLSALYSQCFAEFNASFFGNQLPQYRVRVVFDLHVVANEPVYNDEVSSGLIRFKERCIYIRYTGCFPMTEMLIHEMAHASTGGGHGENWLSEMKRLQEAGAPVSDNELTCLRGDRNSSR